MTVRGALIAVLVLAALALPSVSQATSVSWYIWFNTSQSIGVNVSQQVGASYVAHQTYAGPWKSWKNATMTDLNFHNWLYCVDLRGTMGGGPAWYTANVTPIPGFVPGPDQGTATGLRWAAAIANNWLVGKSATNWGTALERAGVQLAMWEALYDGAGGMSGINLGAGIFKFDSVWQTFGSWDYTAVANQAMSYLQVTGPTGSGLYLDNGQNLYDVPEPGSAILIGLILVAGSGLALRRRRR